MMASADPSSSTAAVDPSSMLRISLDRDLKRLPPTHRAFAALQAVLAGDAEAARELTAAREPRWDPAVVLEPLSARSGQVREREDGSGSAKRRPGGSSPSANSRALPCPPPSPDRRTCCTRPR